MERLDLIIVGAGPAGSVAAYTAAKLGLTTLLIEKEMMPRYKPCGGGLTPKAIDFLEARDLLDKNVVERKCREMKIFAPNIEFTITCKKEMVTLVDRSKFDLSLVRKAERKGAMFNEGEKVKGLHVSSDGVEVVTTRGRYLSKALIGADGVNSIVAKLTNLRKRWKPDEVWLALETTLPLMKSLDQSCIRIYFGDTYSGYGWIFPKKDVVSIGLCGRLAEFINPRERFLKFVQAKYAKRDNLRYHAHLIPLGGIWRENNVYTHRVLLIGDAAGFVDPLTGEGIYHAMLSGEVAAHTISEANQNGVFTAQFLRKYWEKCKKLFWKDMEAAFYLSRIFYDHLNFSMSLLKRDMTIAGYLFPLISGKISYRQLLFRCIFRGLKFLPEYWFAKVIRKV
jgi:geranylgeranyl reductase family protein